MLHIGRSIIRGFRALVFALVCVGVSAGLHVLAGGGLIGAATFGAATAAVAAFGYLLAGAARGPAALLGAAAIAQTGLHVWFCVGAGHLEHLVPTASMLVVHLLATAASALWLARGEAALAAFCDLLVLWSAAAVLVRLFTTAPAHRPRAGGVRTRPASAPALRLLATTTSRRGPPRFAFSH